MKQTKRFYQTPTQEIYNKVVERFEKKGYKWFNGSKTMKLYHHKTDGGAEYLTDTFIKWEHKGKKGKEGIMTNKTKYIVRIDGNIKKDAELNIRE